MSGEARIVGNVTPPYGTAAIYCSNSNGSNRIRLSRYHRNNQPPAQNFSHSSPVNVAQNTKYSPIKIHFDLPLDSSSSSHEGSSNSSEEDSRFSSSLPCLAQDEEMEECVTTGQSSSVYQEEDWWNTQPSVSQLPNNLTTAATLANKRRRLCKVSQAIALGSNDEDEDVDDHIYIGSSNRVSLNQATASSSNKALKRNTLYNVQDSDDGVLLSSSSDLPTKPRDSNKNTHIDIDPSKWNKTNKAQTRVHEWDENGDLPNESITVLDDKENQREENILASITSHSNFVSEGLRKSLYESPSLASRWAIATSAAKKPKSRRISTSPFLPMDNDHFSIQNTMERNASAKRLSYLEERHDVCYDNDDEDSIPRVLQNHELQHDPIDEFSSDEEEDVGVTKSKFKRRTPSSSSYCLSNRSNKKAPNHTNKASVVLQKHVPSIYNTVRSENSINKNDNNSIRRTTSFTSPTGTITNAISKEGIPYNVSQHRHRTVLGVLSNTTNNAVFRKDCSHPKQPHRKMVETTDRLIEEEIVHNNDWLSTTTSRLREDGSSALSTRKTKAKTRRDDDTLERQVVIDMTLDDDSDDYNGHNNGISYNSCIGSNAKARRRGLEGEEVSSSFSTIPLSNYRNDLFGGSGCGTDGVRILAHDNDVDDHGGSKMKKKRKRDSTKSKGVATNAFEEVSSCTAKKRAKSGKGTDRDGKAKKKGKKSFWRLKGNRKGYRKRGSSGRTAKLSSTKSVWSSREGGVGSYSQGRSYSGMSREVGLADVGGASITF